LLQQRNHRPIAVHGAVPIKTPIKYGVNRFWLHQIGSTFQRFSGFVWIFRSDAVQRQFNQLVGLGQSESWFGKMWGRYFFRGENFSAVGLLVFTAYKKN